MLDAEKKRIEKIIVKLSLELTKEFSQYSKTWLENKLIDYKTQLEKL